MPMNRIVMHHTGGNGTPNADDKKAYHVLVAADGSIVQGKHPISANEPGKKLVAGKYAAHTLNLNSGAIGVSMAAMAQAQWGDPKGSTTAFPTEKQLTAFIAEVARLARVYGIPIRRDTVLTHAEVQRTLGVRQKSKWDFDYDPLGVSDARDPLVIGDALRGLIQSKLNADLADGRPAGALPTAPRPTLRRGAKGENVKVLQRALGLTGKAVDGIFGPATEDAVEDFQTAHELRSDGVVGPMTWAALIPTP